MKRGIQVDPERLGPIQPLVVAVSPMPGESLAGLVARATRRNVLRHTRIILAEVGIITISAGTVGMDVETLEERLAAKLGCFREDILARTTPFASRTSVNEILVGGLAMSRLDLDLQHRWISPATLAQSDVHLAAWNNRLLPFCPVSLERLVSHCTECRKRLRWVSAWGIGTCEHCRTPVRHPDGETLNPELVAGYRAFADIVSDDPTKRSAALSRLPAEIAGLDAPALTRLVFGIGRNCRADQKIDANIGRLTAGQVAEVVSVGTDLIHDFPLRLRDAVRRKIDAIGWDEEAPLRQLLHNLRRLGAQNLNRPEQARLIRKALPEAFEAKNRALGGLRAPVMLFRDIQRLHPIQTWQMKRILDNKALKFSMIGSGSRKKVQFDRADAENFVARIHSSAMSSAVERDLGVPRYAVEQLVCIGELRHEIHPAIGILYEGFRVSGHTAYLKDMEAAKKSGEPDERAIPLARAIRRIGGGEKPWGMVLKAMRTRKLVFWLTDVKNPKYRRSAQLSLRAMVLPEDIALFDHVSFNDADHEGAAPFATSMSQVDACDILNIGSKHISAIAAAGGLRFDRKTGCHLVSKVEVLELGSRFVAPTEIVLRAGIHPGSLAKFMNERPDIPRVHGGWSRWHVERSVPGFQPSAARPEATRPS